MTAPGSPITPGGPHASDSKTGTRPDPGSGAPSKAPASRLRRCFDKARNEDRGALSIYLPAGYPDLATSEALLDAALRGGADFVEIGFPFSDPAADGPTIQAAGTAALRTGFRVVDGFDLAARLRAAHPDKGLVCMSYANLAYQMGWDRFAAALADAGFDACILPDVPLEESEPVRSALAGHGIGWVPLVTPTTSVDRVTAIAATATGFLYVVSNVGITGQADPGPLVETTVTRVRTAQGTPTPGGATRTPLVVGFGIRSPADVARVLAAGADGAIVGSHLIALVAGGAGPEEVRTEVARLFAGTHKDTADSHTV